MQELYGTNFNGKVFLNFGETNTLMSILTQRNNERLNVSFNHQMTISGKKIKLNKLSYSFLLH